MVAMVLSVLVAGAGQGSVASYKGARWLLLQSPVRNPACRVLCVRVDGGYCGTECVGCRGGTRFWCGEQGVRDGCS